MKAITTGRMARALQKVFPTVTERKVRHAIKKRKIRTLDEPFSCWAHIDPDWVREDMQGSLMLTNEQTRSIMADLGFNRLLPVILAA